MAVQRIGSGGTVIVRTGQLAGVGPVGPKGSRGDTGADGPQGVQGDTGPAGYVVEQLLVTPINPDNIPVNTETILEHGSIAVDDGEWWSPHPTNIVFPDENAYLVNAFVVFDDPAGDGEGIRELTFYEDAAVIAQSTVPANAADNTTVTISMAFVSNPSATYTFKVRQSDDSAVDVTSGRVSINRIGAGPQGIQGPVGPQGSTGATGSTGPQGPAGNANSGFDDISDLGLTT